MRRHANYVATVGAALLVIGFGLITAQETAQVGDFFHNHGWLKLGIGCVIAGVAAVVTSTVIYAWLPRKVRYLHADKRRHELKTGEKLGPGRSLYSRSGRHRLEMAEDGNLIEWGDGVLAMWKTDTERTGKANYLTLEPDGSLVVCAGDGSTVKVVDGTKGCGGTRLVVQDDAQLVMLKNDNSMAWRTGLGFNVTWNATPLR